VSIGSVTDGLLRCDVYCEAGDDISSVVLDPTGVNLAFSLIRKGASGFAQIWARLAPPALTSKDIVITNSGFHMVIGGAQCYSGVNQSLTPDAAGDQVDIFLTSATLPLTTIADNCWMFAASIPGAMVAGAGASLIIDQSDGAGQDLNMFDSNGALTPAGAKTMTVAYPSGSGNFYSAFCSFAPSAGGGGSVDEPVTRRFGAVPHCGTTKMRGGHRGGVWGQTKSGLSIPKWLSEREAA
jgi:hypothetical protein